MSKFYWHYTPIRILFSAFFLLGLSYISHSQTIQNTNKTTTYNKCGFEFKRNLFLSNATNNAKALQQEKDIKKYTTNGQPKSNDIYTIPVVVHVLHLGEAVGTGTNISDAQINSAITHLNQVYRGQTTNSPVDFGIQFSLAQQDPNCNASNGINRVDASGIPNYSSGGVDYYEDGGEADEYDLKDLSKWPVSDYFNIWIVPEIENNNGGAGIQGYANFFTGSNNYEGSMMMANVFGYDPNNSNPSFNLKAPRDNGTVVHEFGHYLHLYHTFQGDNDADQNGIGDNCPGDVTVGVDSDGCADTEIHKRHTSQCKTGQNNDCTGAIFGNNVALNFMSYASCQDRLTNDQKIRARAMLSTSGISLIYSNGDENPVSTTGSLSPASCIPQTDATGLSGGYAGIMEMTIINTYSNITDNAQNDGGYLDFSNQCLKTINLYEDSSYTFEIETWFNPHNVKGYIDFNNDGDFIDPNEEILNLNIPSNPNPPYKSSSQVNYTIPSVNSNSVLGGTKLRLRLNADISAVSNACEAPLYGQVEDYAIIINQAAGAGPCSATYSTDSQTACDTYTWIDGNTYTTSVNPTLNTNHNVQTQGMTFTPYTININVGDTVTFYNTGGYHNVNGSLATFPNNPEGFYSGNPSSSNWTFTHVFTLPGTYDYWCDPHAPSMAGVINVTSLNNITHTINNSQGCDSIITLDLTINSSPTVSIGNDTTICDNAFITLDAGSGYSSYLWSNGSTVQTINVNSSGTYSVTVTDNNNCSGSDDIAINTISCNNSTTKTYVPDDNFEAYLEANNMGDGIANNDSVLTANIDTVSTIDVSSQNITDLTGIEDFSALTGLYCSGNQLTNLDISNNTALTYLDCGYNQLSYINVNNNTALESLSCRYNQLASLNVSNNTSIEYLFCNNNQLTSLDLTQNNNLIWLYCDANNLTNLDVSENTSLEILSCQLNQLTSLDVSESNSLTYLDCLNNQLTCLNVKNGNNINLIAIQNPNLTCIEVDDPNWSNQNWTVASGNIDNGVTFSLNCNYTSDCFQSSSNGSGPKTYTPDDNFEAYLEASNMGDGISGNDSVFTSNISGVISLNVDSLNISSLTGLEDFTNLAVLSCRYNSLTSLDISQNTNLYKLNCRYNQISALDVTQNTALKMLNCNDNVITALDVSQNTELVNLACEDNQLTSLDVSNNSDLKYFICGDNQLTSLDVSNNTSLTYLGFHANQISSIDVSNNVALKVLSFGKNQLSTIDVSNNTQLNVFRCYENQITSLNLSANSNLHTIDCSYNPLTCLNLKNGNNSNITDFDATRNSSLNCIEVDDVNWATTHLSVSNNNIDSAVTFSTNCSYPAGCASNQSGGSGGGTGSYPPASVFCNGTPTAVVDVTNPVTGKTWMDRNLGASRAATSSTDTLAYGDLYQWGRAADGHQCRNSNTTTTLSSTDQPGHGDFINSFGLGQDWQSPQNDNLWQGVNGINNPCPSGYRIPTEAEWEEEYLSWITSDAAGAMSSPLKLPRTGYRTSGFYQIGWMGQYWTSTTSSQFSRLINFVNNVNIQDGIRNSGNAVRCIKDY